jgi:hypothetical protein
MPAIIYQKTPGGLFATGERTVSTFPSGLVRVDQTFICPTSDAATHRADLAVGNNMPGGSAPAIDGLKIFPEPQEKKLDNGFTEFVVSAYGRTSATGTTTYEWKFTQGFSYMAYPQSGGKFVVVKKDSIYKNKIKKVTFVTKQSEEISFDTTGATLPVRIVDDDWSPYNEWIIGVTDLSYQNYGHFSEVSYIVDGFKKNISVVSSGS